MRNCWYVIHRKACRPNTCTPKIIVKRISHSLSAQCDTNVFSHSTIIHKFVCAGAFECVTFFIVCIELENIHI